MKTLTVEEKAQKAQQAKTFEKGISESSYLNVKMQLTCDCEPYIDTFTLPRWNAQGYKIKKGSKAIRNTVYIEKETKNKETGETKTNKYPKSVNLFCRCQVEKSDR